MPRDDEDILTELRERYDYADGEWQDIRSEGRIDMQYLAGDCFALDPAARQARKEKQRPIVDADELSQYVNQLLGKARQNKRGINVSAVGGGATDETARFRQGKIRDIEYRSNAQQAYAVLLENAAQRSYGFLRIKSIYATDEGFDQDLRIEPIVNPDMVTPDPDDLRSDGSGMRYLFYEESRSLKEFTREFPDARTTDFSGELPARASSWVGQDRIRLAEYWTKERGKKRTRLLLKPVGRSADNPDPQPFAVWLDELHTKPSSEQILKSREVDTPRVVKYLTNGVEILETVVWPGASIPFVACYGKILYVDDGTLGSKRKLLSLIRLARSPQMLYAYYRTQQAEMAGMIPKIPVIGYKGQFTGVERDWEKAPHEPLAFIEVNAKTEETGDQILEKPTRLAYEAGSHLQALELCAEGARRAIQAAIGASFLPTQAQRHNEKSGVALKQIEDTADTGSFHFLDHFNDAIMRTGAILDENIPHFYDTARDTSIRDEEDKVQIVRVNDPTALQDGQPAHVPTDAGEHDVTLSVGPALASEHDAASSFADMLLGNTEIMQLLGPQKGMKLAAAAVRLKNVGPIGDQIAELLDPKEEQQQDPQQVAQQAQQLQGQLQEMGQKLQQAAQIIHGKQVEAASRERIAQLQVDAKRAQAEIDADKELALQVMKNAAGIAEAHIAASAKGVSLAAHAQEEAQALGHEAMQANHDRAHEVGMAAMQHQQTLAQGQQALGQQAALADQSHQQALEQGDQSHQQQLAQGQQAAMLAPPPAADTGAEA